MAVELNWAQIEADYRAGIMSLREIATAHGLTEGGIRKRAKRDQWARDLTARIQARAEEKVRNDAARVPSTQLTPADEEKVVEINATQIADIRNAHRSDIAGARGLAAKLLGELTHQTDHADLYERLGELLEQEGDESSAAAQERHRKMREAYQRALSLGSRTKTLLDLANTLKTLIGLEREAYGISPTSDSGVQPVGTTPSNQMAREIAYALHKGLLAANDTRSPPRQAAS